MDTQENSTNTNTNTNTNTSASADTNVGTGGNTNHEKGPNVLMGVLSYLGPLVIVSYLVAKDEPFVKFHIKQGLVLFCIEILVAVVAPMFFYGMYGIFRLIHLATTVLSIIGIINVVQKKEKELPVVGGLSSYFTF